MDENKLQSAISDFIAQVKTMEDVKGAGNVTLQINVVNGKMSKNYKVVTEIYKVSE